MESIGVRLYDDMKQVSYIPVDVSKVPYTFTIKLAGKTFEMCIKYNDVGEFFTVDLALVGGEILAYGDIVRYGRPLFGSIEDERFPYPVIIPYCYTGDGISEVTKENFGTEIRLYLYERWS